MGTFEVRTLRRALRGNVVVTRWESLFSVIFLSLHDGEKEAEMGEIMVD